MNSSDHNLHRPEILAPVGNAAMLTAAVRSGADAVYLGGSDFNARMKADGFDDAALCDAVRYCHEHFVRVYYTFNTLLFDDELTAARQALCVAAEAGVDAVIVQDLAVVSLMREIDPQMPLHASTQMTIHNLDGALAARKLGFDRVVLAREMSKDEIALVTGGVDIETEIFVHGAHCMSVSGQCTLSAMIGGRSGNRGMCAQPCRLPFSGGSGRTGKADGASGYALSLKDLSLIEHVEELRGLGVTSLKIEGRLKRPEYVAAAVTELRRTMEGGQPDMELLASVFSRSGFTDGYFRGERDRSMFGVRTRENAVAAKEVLADIALAVKDEPDLWPLDMKFTLRAGEPATLTVMDGSACVTVQGPVPEVALTAALTNERLQASLSKLGGTPYYLNDLTAALDGGLMLRSSGLNEMRRAAIQQIAEKRVSSFSEGISTYKSRTNGEIRQNTPLFFAKNSVGSTFDSQYDPKTRTNGEIRQNDAAPKLRIRVSDAAQLTPYMAEQADAIIAPPGMALDLAGSASHEQADIQTYGKLIAELPVVAFDDNTEALRRQVKALLGQGLRHFTVGNLYGLELLYADTGQAENEYAGEIVLHGDSGLNITNALSMHDYLNMGLTDVTLSPELSKQRILAVKDLSRAGILAYGYLPLMQLRNCPGRPCPRSPVPPASRPDAKSACRPCVLTDRLGKRFPLICQDGITTLHNCVPLYIGDKFVQFKGRPAFYTLYFQTESPKECEAVTRSFLEGECLSRETTGGLYFR